MGWAGAFLGFRILTATMTMTMMITIMVTISSRNGSPVMLKLKLKPFDEPLVAPRDDGEALDRIWNVLRLSVQLA